MQFLVRCASFSRSHFVTQRASFSLGYLVRSGLPTFCNVTNTIYNFNKSIFCNRTTTFLKQNQPPKNWRKNLKVQHLQCHQKETNEIHQNAVASAVSDLNPNFFLKLCERKLKIAANVHLDPEWNAIYLLKLRTLNQRAFEEKKRKHMYRLSVENLYKICGFSKLDTLCAISTYKQSIKLGNWIKDNLCFKTESLNLRAFEEKKNKRCEEDNIQCQTQGSFWGQV